MNDAARSPEEEAVLEAALKWLRAREGLPKPSSRLDPAAVSSKRRNARDAEEALAKAVQRYRTSISVDEGAEKADAAAGD